VTTTLTASSVLSDIDIVKRVRSGEPALFEILMRRHNHRLYRAARAVIRDEADIEDVMQQAYLRAFTHLDQFEERALFSTWLTRILLNEAFGRRRQLRRLSPFPETANDADADHGVFMNDIQSPHPDPERQASVGEIRQALEDAVDALPDAYRTVFMLRDIEGLSTTETGEVMGLADQAVKTRLHRARVMIRRNLVGRIGAVAPNAFPFHARRCDRIVAAVLGRIGGDTEISASKK